MAKNNCIIINCNIFTPKGHKALCGEKMKELHSIGDAFIKIEDGVISEIGNMSDYTPNDDFAIIDAGGKAVLPGFVDSHTHLIFGGFRAEEFDWRLKGESYMSLMERGGGIQSTVNATRKSTAEDLARRGRWFVDRMAECGVTTMEVKTGYGLSLESELEMLRAIELLQEEEKDKITIESTFLGAHAVPTEYKGRTAEYTDHIIRDMLPEFKGRVTFCDIFTEKNVFEIEDSRRLLTAAREAGFKLKLHADEIVTLGGAELAGELGAISADHLLHISDKGIESLRKSGTVATLLPLTAFALREPYAPARKLIDAGCAVALATDLNPGSCFSGSIPLTIALACLYMDMTTEEMISALTLNGAAALDLADKTGSVEVGKRGDLVILNFDTYKALPYYVGMNCVNTTIHGGKISYRQEFPLV